MRKYQIAVLVVLAALLCGCGEAQEVRESKPVPEPNVATAPTPTTAPTHTGGTFTSSCEYILDFENGHTFVASAFLDGPPGSVVDVTATWRQVDGNHAVVTQRVIINTDGVAEVYFTIPATTEDVQQIQALPYDQQCQVDATYVSWGAG